MQEFHYVAQDDDGRRYNGSLKAETRDLALKTLSERFTIVTRLETRTQSSSLGFLTGRVGGEDLLNFCETLSTMLEGGVTLKRSLDTLLGDTENQALRNVIMDLSARVGSGDSLSKAMAEHPQVFDRFFIFMVKAGEASGELPEMIRRVASYLEKMQGMADKVKSAFVYPTVVLAFAGLLVLLILTFGVPYLEGLYDGLGLELPLPTLMVAGLGRFLSEYFLVVILMGLCVVFLIRVFLRHPKGRYAVDLFKLETPVVKGLFRQLYSARFARTLALLYSSGIPLLEALELTGQSVGNVLVEKAVVSTQKELQQGSNLSDSLRSNPYFSDAAVGLVSAGEDSGTLDVMLAKVADFYDRKVNSKLTAVTSLVEPLIMIGVGIVIGGIILSLGLPFLTLASNF